MIVDRSAFLPDDLGIGGRLADRAESTQDGELLEMAGRLAPERIGGLDHQHSASPQDKRQRHQQRRLAVTCRQSEDRRLVIDGKMRQHRMQRA